MPAVFEFPLRVRPDEIDGQGHVNNVAYVEWMQAAAVAHSTAQGWPADRYRAAGVGWVVRSHAIEYHRPAFDGEAILVRTWVATMHRVTSLRRYRILRATDQILLARAETLWAFVSYTTGRATRIPADVAGAFELVPDPPTP